MRIPQNASQRIKGGLHLFQLLFIFVAGCVTLAIYTKDGSNGGEVAYYFALCFVTIPAIIYLTMVPMWTRAWRLNNVYAFATLDMLYAVFWFAAFIAILAWTATADGDDNKDDSSDDEEKKTCHGGSEYKCTLAKVSGGMGAIVFIMFVATSYYSIKDVMAFKRTGVMPNGQPAGQRPLDHNAMGDDAAKDAWSANTDELDPNHPSNRLPNDNDDRDDHDPRQPLGYGHVPGDEDQGLLGYNPRRPSPSPGDNPFADSSVAHDGPGDSGVHPGRRLSYESSMYSRPTVVSPTPPPPVPDMQSQYITPSALSPTHYDHASGDRLNFPQANYGRL